MTHVCLSGICGNIHQTFIDYLFMQFDGLLLAQEDLVQQSKSNNHNFLEDADPQQNEIHTFMNHLSTSLASYNPVIPRQRGRQEMSMNIFEQARGNQCDLPLFYKLSQDLMGQEDKAGSVQKQVKTNQRCSKNDTKNIPKNFGKGIINFIQKQQKKVRQLILSHGLSHQQFLKLIRHEKKTINTIADLRRLWTNPKFGRVMRIVSNLFLRQYAFEYIFNSRIVIYSTHIKYRHILWEALKDPSNFNRIKEY